MGAPVNASAMSCGHGGTAKHRRKYHSNCTTQEVTDDRETAAGFGER